MALQGPFAVIADSPAPEVVDALRAAGGFPDHRSDLERRADRACCGRARSGHPRRYLPGRGARRGAGGSVGRAAGERRRPVHAGHCAQPRRRRAGDPGCVCDRRQRARPQRLVRRLSTALRIRALHGTVLRRMRTLASRGEQLPELSSADPLDEASVLVAGRGRSYPALSVAIGEQVGAGRRALRRKRRARAQCARHRRHGDRRRFRPAKSSKLC